MNRTTGQQFGLLLSVLAGAVPVVFAGMRFFSTGTDLRALWMALAALAGVLAVFALGKANERPTRVVMGLAIAATIAGACCAALVVSLLGTHGQVGIWMVATGFGMCFSASRAIALLSRPNRTS